MIDLNYKKQRPEQEQKREEPLGLVILVLLPFAAMYLIAAELIL